MKSKRYGSEFEPDGGCREPLKETNRISLSQALAGRIDARTNYASPRPGVGTAMRRISITVRSHMSMNRMIFID